MLGLPDRITACLFDLDGVLTQTAAVHARAWKQAFDELLHARAAGGDEPYVPFDARADYDRHVDGKPRTDGVRDFLASRGIHLPEGDPGDAPGTATIAAVGNRKNELLLGLIEHDGVAVYEGSVRFVDAAGAAGLQRCVVSSSTNCRAILTSVGLLDRFEHIVDGHVAREAGLEGKPAPDTFLHGARLLGVEPGHAAVFEDALAGVEAGRAGHFGTVVGVDRVGHRDALAAHGADIVVGDLDELLDAGPAR